MNAKCHECGGRADRGPDMRCSQCLRALIEDVLRRHGERIRAMKAEVLKPCFVPTAEHSPLSEPMTVDDMLYETLGYYS